MYLSYIVKISSTTCTIINIIQIIIHYSIISLEEKNYAFDISFPQSCKTEIKKLLVISYWISQFACNFISYYNIKQSKVINVKKFYNSQELLM